MKIFRGNLWIFRCDANSRQQIVILTNDFALAERAFRAKWSRALSSRWVQTTCALVHLSSGPVRSSLGRFVDAPLARLARRLPGAQGWTKPVRETV